MKLRTRLDLFSAALLSALGASQLAGCGGSATTFTSSTGGASDGGAGASTGGASGAGTAGGHSAGSGHSGGAIGSAGSVGTAGAGNRYPCTNPKDDGYGVITCDDFTHLEHSGKCESHLPTMGVKDPPPGNFNACTKDSDCTDAPYGWCGTSFGQVQGTVCNYGCKENSDCGAQEACVCGPVIGACVHVDCTSDAECGPGFSCKGYDSSGGCNFTTYTCQTNADTCGSDKDCVGNAAGNLCGYNLEQKRFACKPGGCAIGRPFLVEGEQRLAPVAPRTDWSELALLPRLEKLDASISAHLAERWARVALMEHASIAAFARFTLQLMSLGAPPELVELSTSAMADETKHAKACFAVANGYSATPIGPGRLQVDSSLNEMSLHEIVLNTIREGCVGETVAAVEAREAAEHAADPALRALLLTISEDETRHAELAFRFVKWALAQGDATLERAVRSEFEALALEGTPLPRALSALELETLRHGIAPEPLRASIRAQAIANVILPCAQALFESGGRQQHLEAPTDGQHVRVAARAVHAVQA